MAEQSAESAESVAKEAVAQYSKKLQEAVSSFGAPTIRETTEGAYVAGVAFAKVGDYGAGHKSLVVVYLAHAMPNAVAIEDVASAYEMEIWDAGFEGGVNRIYADALDVRNSGSILAGIQISSLDGRLWIERQSMRDDGTFVTSYYGLDENGDYRKVDEPASASQAVSALVPFVLRDVPGYGLELGLSLSDSELWQIGVEKPVANTVAWPIESGWYSATLSFGGFKSSYLNSGCVSEVALDGAAIKTRGVFSYAKSREDLYKRDKEFTGLVDWEFPLGDPVEYQLIGGANGPHAVDVNRFEEALRYSGLALILEVVDGRVVHAEVSS